GETRVQDYIARNIGPAHVPPLANVAGPESNSRFVYAVDHVVGYGRIRHLHRDADPPRIDVRTISSIVDDVADDRVAGCRPHDARTLSIVVVATVNGDPDPGEMPYF